MKGVRSTPPLGAEENCVAIFFGGLDNGKPALQVSDWILVFFANFEKHFRTSPKTINMLLFKTANIRQRCAKF